MNNHPIKIRFVNKKVKKERTIHLVTKTKEKSLRFALANCKQWILHNAFPFTIIVSYGFYFTKRGAKKEITNEMICKNLEDYKWALQAFIQEYYE